MFSLDSIDELELDKLESSDRDEKYEFTSIINKCFLKTKGKEAAFSFNIIFSSSYYEIRF